jgi:hypothetical protein
VGTVGDPVTAIADEPHTRILDLAQLRGVLSRAFVIRLYTGYHGGGARARLSPDVLEQIREYGAAGFQIELVLTYMFAESDAQGYADFVSGVVREVGPLIYDAATRHNEANASLGIGASDGNQPGARSALMRGVIAAHSAIRTGGLTTLKSRVQRGAYQPSGRRGLLAWSRSRRRG